MRGCEMSSKHMWIATVAVIAVVATLAILAAVNGAFGPAPAVGTAGPELPVVCRENSRQVAELESAKLIIENNATDKDLGVHGEFDGEGWSELCVFDPNGRPIVVFDPRNQLNDLTMGGVFFESREPPASEYSMEDLAADFPEGTYTVRGETFDGKVVAGSARFTHDLPAPPKITAPDLAEEPEKPGPPLPREDFVVDWERVTETVAGDPVKITGYEVIVTKEDFEDRNGFSRPIYDVHVPPALDSLSVPREFLEPETVYELEVLSLEESGNQTIRVGFFVTG
jgi:hypothetical protein